jgi:hypothetical protein
VLAVAVAELVSFRARPAVPMFLANLVRACAKTGMPPLPSLPQDPLLQPLRDAIQDQQPAAAAASEPILARCFWGGGRSGVRRVCGD